MTAQSAGQASSSEMDGDDLAFLDLLRHLGEERDPNALYRELDRALERLVRFERIAVARFNPITRSITTVYERGVGIGLPERYELIHTGRRSLSFGVISDGAGMLHTVPDDIDVYRGDAIRRRYGLRQVLVSPIVARGAAAGVLKLYSTDPDRFTSVTIGIAERHSRALGLALGSVEGHVEIDATTERLIADVALDIACAESQARLLDALYRGIVTATGAAVLRFERQRSGQHVFVDARNSGGVRAPGQSVDDIGEELAHRLTGLLQAASERQDVALLSHDDTSIPALQIGPLGDLFNTTAVIVVPMRAGEESLGVLVGAWPDATSGAELERHTATFRRLVELAVPALQRTRRIEHLEQRLSESETIRRLTESIVRTPRFRDALDLICRTSELITGLDVVVAGETTSDHLIWHAASGAADMSFIGQRVPIPSHIFSRILRSSEQVVLEDVRHTPELPPEIVPLHTREGLRSTVVVPIYVHARLRGMMMFSSRRLHRFTDDEISMIQALAGTMATAVAASDALPAGPEDT